MIFYGKDRPQQSLRSMTSTQEPMLHQGVRSLSKELNEVLINYVLMAFKFKCMIMFYDVRKSHVNQISSINNQEYMYYATVRCY